MNAVGPAAGGDRLLEASSDPRRNPPDDLQLMRPPVVGEASDDLHSDVVALPGIELADQQQERWIRRRHRRRMEGRLHTVVDDVDPLGVESQHLDAAVG